MVKGKEGLLMDIAIAIVCLLIGFGGGWFTSSHFYNKSVLISSQIMPREVPKIRGLPAVVLSGTNSFILGPDRSRKLSNISPYTLKAEKDGTITLRGDLYDKRGFVVALLRDSILHLSPGIKYDINSDERAIEIVNAKLQPVFQIWKASEKEVKMAEKEFQKKEKDMKSRGMPIEHLIPIFKALSRNEVLIISYVNYYPSKNNKVIAEIADSDGTMITDNINSIAQRIKGIKRIFEYPGFEYPGVRRHN